MTFVKVTQRFFPSKKLNQFNIKCMQTYVTDQHSSFLACVDIFKVILYLSWCPSLVIRGSIITNQRFYLPTYTHLKIFAKKTGRFLPILSSKSTSF